MTRFHAVFLIIVALVILWLIREVVWWSLKGRMRRLIAAETGVHNPALQVALKAVLEGYQPPQPRLNGKFAAKVSRETQAPAA